MTLNFLIKPANHAIFKWLLLALLSPWLLSMQGCDQAQTAPQDYDPKFIEPSQDLKQRMSFAVHPLHNPTRLHEVFQPLIDYLNQQIMGVEFYLEASRDYPAFDRKLQNRTVDFALPNPYQTVESIKHGYKVVAKMGDDENFRGIILVHKDSPFKEPKDLIGHSISYPAPTALAATMMPQYFLYQHGVKINDVRNSYVGSQESSIMNVLHKQTDAAATWPPPWEALTSQRPELKKQLKVIWQTPSLPNNAVVAKNEISDNLIRQVQTILVNLHLHKTGQNILQGMHLSKFELAQNQTYQPVEAFIQDFSEHVRLPSENK